MQKTVLITGGAGFIGSHLCDYYIKKQYKVICIDSFFSGKKDNIKHLLDNKDFVLIKHNIIHPLKKKFDNIDKIYNLACPASPVQYQFDPILTLRSSVEGTRNMLDLARKYNARMLQASTSEVYGDPLEHPQKETYFGNVDPLGKRSCYDEGKRAAESLCKDYNEQYGVDVRIVRLFNVYGPNMMFNDGRVVSNFILQVIFNEDITIHGTGDQSRSFMYVDDLIEGFIQSMMVDKEKIGIGPINLGNPDERTITNLAESIIKVANSNSNITYTQYEKIPERWGDPQKRCPDISKAMRLLNWKPKITFEEGLKKTIKDFKDRLDNKSKVIIFSPSYLPLEGPAEKTVKEITDSLIGYEFDLITAKLKKGLESKEKIGNVNIYRIGFGSKLDKYILPFIAPIKALTLHKRNNYQFTWGIMASYGSLAGLLFSFFSNTAFLVSLFEGKIDNNRPVRNKLLKPFYKVIFKKVHYLQIIADLNQQQLAWLEDDQTVQAIDLNKDSLYISKKTKELFQKLEIFNSRM